MDGELPLSPRRHRLPNRRSSVTQTLHVAGRDITATVGFAADGGPAELFLNAGRSGSEIDFLLGDAAVSISVALQHGVSAKALAKSVARLPLLTEGPGITAASAVGAALDLIASFEK
jgi:ribonucleoside-diphosphate reductase alpha chain